ncbi:integrase [Pseudomonas putida]|uniref:integrase n=1 Tax=Pseudomonas putida TaxID=303 RepID=UPI00300ECD9E
MKNNQTSTDDVSSLIADLNEPVPPGTRPPKGFVLCRHRDGSPSAVYGQLVWDFNPVRLSAKLISKIRFDNFLGALDDTPKILLIDESQYILFCIAYYASSGYSGSISAQTLLAYANTIGYAVRYCYSLKDNPLVGVISLEQLFTTPAYMDGFLKYLKDRPKLQRNTLQIAQRLKAMGVQCLGYEIRIPDQNKFPRPKKRKQHPVIPVQLYICLIDILIKKLDEIYETSLNLESFIEEFSNRMYGVAHRTQHMIVQNTKIQLHPTFAEGARTHGVADFFTNYFPCDSRVSLPLALSSIQYTLKYVIHTFTGMRDQEVGRLPYNCLHKEEVETETLDDNGLSRDPALIIDLISTSTKHSGYRKNGSWYATAEVVKAVRAAQAINRGLCKILGEDHQSTSLFISSGCIHYNDKKLRASAYDKSSKPDFLKELIITEKDLSDLCLSDSDRTFLPSEGFAVGKPWPLTSHQLRRSLAFYASNSGFVTMPTLSKQFKHLALQMTRYYANGFEKIKSIFGFYNPKKDQFEIPHDHLLYDFQLSIPIHAAYELISEVLGEMPIYGGGGAQIEKQRNRIANDEITILEFRSETLKSVQAGELIWRPTLLGGCMKRGECDTYMLGQITSCLTCPGAAISPSKLDSAIDMTTQEISSFPPTSGEYQILSKELKELEEFRIKHMRKGQPT